MTRITLRQLQKRTSHELLSDARALCITASGPMTVRMAERATESRYPTHRHLRFAAMKHFEQNGWDVLRHGVGVWGANGVLADFAIAKRKKIVLIECLTAGWTDYRNVQRKRRLGRYFPVWFVLEDPDGDDSEYEERVQRLRNRFTIFVWSKARGVRRLRPSPARSPGLA